MHAALIGMGVAVLLVNLLVLAVALRINREVKTLKDQATIGMLASETGTRRVEQLPNGDRTTQEQRHLDADALKEAPNQDGE